MSSGVIAGVMLAFKIEPNAHECIKDCNSSPVVAEAKGRVPLILTAEKKTL